MSRGSQLLLLGGGDARVRGGGWAGVDGQGGLAELRPRPDAHSPRTRQHWVSEQVFDWAQVGAVHLRATVFHENIRALAALGAVTGELAVPLGDERNTIPLVSAADVARAAALLEDPSRPAEPFYRLVGSVPTIADIIAEFGTAPEPWLSSCIPTGTP